MLITMNLAFARKMLKQKHYFKLYKLYKGNSKELNSTIFFFSLSLSLFLITSLEHTSKISESIVII